MSPSAPLLVERARDAVEAAYVPYSDYAVGAAIETADGSMYTGCNVEIVNYSNSLHAEEVALSQAVLDGHRTFTRLAVSSDRRDGVTPCGMCRQTLREFCEEDLMLFCDRCETVDRYSLGELLPAAMSGETIR